MLKKTVMATLAFLVLAAIVQAQVRAISPETAHDLLAGGKDLVLLDVRTAEEFLEIRIPGAVLLPYDRIDAESAARVIGGKDRIVIVYCRSGRRSAAAAASLVALGYRNVLDMGAITSWPYETVKGETKEP
ncbi:MAG: rhodanese-like domain-containing protein [Spirochaetes bacterium]|nr:rhodanese-like domain-containing protein [Spirochaetota bacterium]